MATTIAESFPPDEHATLSPRKVEILREWYVQVLGDADKASDIEDSIHYSAWADALLDVLNLLHTDSMTGEPDL
jgi:hypothetical protein